MPFSHYLEGSISPAPAWLWTLNLKNHARMQQEMEELKLPPGSTGLIQLFVKLTSTGDYRKTIKDKLIP